MRSSASPSVKSAGALESDVAARNHRKPIATMSQPERESGRRAAANRPVPMKVSPTRSVKVIAPRLSRIETPVNEIAVAVASPVTSPRPATAASPRGECAAHPP